MHQRSIGPTVHCLGCLQTGQTFPFNSKVHHKFGKEDPNFPPSGWGTQQLSILMAWTIYIETKIIHVNTIIVNADTNTTTIDIDMCNIQSQSYYFF